MAIYALKSPIEWAKQSLEKAEIAVLRVVRVFPPKDTWEGDDAEVLYLDDRERPRTAYLKPDGAVVITTSGW